MFDNAPGSLPALDRQGGRGRQKTAELVYEGKMAPVLRQGLAGFAPADAASYEISLKFCFMSLLLEALHKRDAVFATDLGSMAAMFSPFSDGVDPQGYASLESKFVLAVAGYQERFSREGNADLRRALTFIGSLQVSAVFRGPQGQEVIARLSPQAAAHLPIQ